ncbi:MAG TPA: SRPBCC family protein [Candidatus Xenobia bacterium]|jgi:hypothetical protein
MHSILAMGAPLHSLHREQWVPQSLDRVFEFFQDPYNLQHIVPPHMRFQVVSHEGTLIRYRLRILGFPARWRTRITTWESPIRFVDTQLNGPYVRWEHLHTFEPRDDGVVLSDHVTYQVPFGPLGELLHRLLITHELRRIFDYRQQAIADRFSGGVVQR